MNLVFESIAFKLKTNVSVGMVVVAEVAIMGKTQCNVFKCSEIDGAASPIYTVTISFISLGMFGY